MAFDGSHGLSAAFTVDAGDKAFAVSVFMLFEAQHEMEGRSVVLLDGNRPAKKSIAHVASMAYQRLGPGLAAG